MMPRSAGHSRAGTIGSGPPGRDHRNGTIAVGGGGVPGAEDRTSDPARRAAVSREPGGIAILEARGARGPRRAARASPVILPLLGVGRPGRIRTVGPLIVRESVILEGGVPGGRCSRRTVSQEDDRSRTPAGIRPRRGGGSGRVPVLPGRSTRSVPTRVAPEPARTGPRARPERHPHCARPHRTPIDGIRGTVPRGASRASHSSRSPCRSSRPLSRRSSSSAPP